ncbi:MAG TPA: UDP-N-acetylmuramoyl-tripeptide--D-alanyl-D-alanine ligase [Acidimicrobiia bacterium]|nr:UDP-N-acetylmuramoyl-tripeptide--D-alanyl-D-alanine ligase [Acidimicrobiia bacterium]
MRWDLDTVAAATGGIAVGDAVVTGVVADSRRVTPGVLFVALRGNRVDGHEFVGAAMSAGAAALLVEPGRLPDDCPGVEVADPAAALIALGALRRGELEMPVVAITGSSGKTTTKDLTAAVLGPGTHASPDSYNNEVGVPLTVLSCPDDAGALVLEVGSRGVGHIAALADLVRPDVAVITNIGPAHLEHFGDLATTRRAKWELVEALAPGGTAVLPAGDGDLTGRGHPRMLTFGEDAGADVVVSAITLDAAGRAAFTIAHDGQRLAVSLTVAGRHQPRNAAAAVCAALAVGIPLETAVSRLAGARVSPWRMEVAERTIPGGVVTVVNDAYNANPASMEAALETVAALPGRHLAVLGMMHELGPAAPDLHEAVGRLAAELGFVVVVVGDDPGIARGAGESLAAVVSDPGAAAAAVRSLLHPGDVVLIKASRATGLERLAESIGGGAAA